MPHTRSLAHYWNGENEGHWRKWRGKYQWLNAPQTLKWNNYDKDMKTRKLAYIHGEYIPRWGHRTKGMFTIQEGYYIKSKNMNSITVPLW